MLNTTLAMPQPQRAAMADTTDIAMCATGRSGLGHLRRVTNVAASLRHLLPHRDITLVSNAPADGMHDHEQQLYSGILQAERSHMAQTAAVRSALITVVDTAVLPELETVSGKLCLILRETVASRLPEFRLAGGRKWDLVLVPNPRECWMPCADTIAARRVEPVGWIYRSLDRQVCSAVMPRASSTKRILVASGGGGNAETAGYLTGECQRIVAELRRRFNGQLLVTQATGPRMSRSASVEGCDEYVDPGPRLNEFFDRFDLIISTAGYNSVLELAQLSRPVILMPIARTFDDQTERAVQWATRLGHAHLPGKIDTTARWAAQALQSDYARQPCDLGASGGHRAASLLLELLQ